MTLEPGRGPRVEALQAEISNASSRIGDLMKTSDQLFVLAVTGIVGTLALGGDGTEGVLDLVTIALPIGLSVVAAYNFRISANINALGGYRAALEERLSDDLAGSPFLWESAVVPKLKRGASFIGSHIMFNLAFLASVLLGCIRGLVYVGDRYSGWTETVCSLGLLLGWGAALVSLALAYRHSVNSFSIAYRETSSLLRSDATD